jgi:transcription initiation factor TFIID subunit 1
MDLATIRDKISKYDYRTANAMLKDFELMKTNAIKFNGSDSMIAAEASAIYDFVKSRLEANKAELTHLEEAVEDQMNTSQPKKRRKKAVKKTTKKAAANASGGGAASSGLDESFLGMATDINLDDLDFSDDSDD